MHLVSVLSNKLHIPRKNCEIQLFRGIYIWKIKAREAAAFIQVI